MLRRRLGAVENNGIISNIRNGQSLWARWGKRVGQYTHLIAVASIEGRRFGRCLTCLCGPCLRFFRSDPDEYKALKIFLGFPFGLALGAVFYLAVIMRMELPEIAEYVIGGLFTMALSVGCAVSVQVRCISLLVIPAFLGKHGRTYIMAFAFAFLLTGPIANMMDNAKEVTRAVSCGAEVAQNLTAAKAELRLQPIRDIMKDLQFEAKNVNKITTKVKGAFQPVQYEVEDTKETKKLKQGVKSTDQKLSLKSRAAIIEKRQKKRKITNKADAKEKKYTEKVDYRCEDVFSVGVKQCYKVFEVAHTDCMNTLSIAGYVLCLPLKLTVICQLTKYIPGWTGASCDGMKAVNKGFGGSIRTAEEASDAFGSNFNVNMQYKIESSEEELARKTAADVSLAVAYEFKWRRIWFDFVITVIKRCMAFLFLRVLFSAHRYHQKYVTDFRFDNIYLTPYFKRIDRRRLEKRKSTLLPLKKLENNDTIDPGRLALSGPETSKLFSSTLKLIFRLLTFGMVFFIDRMIYVILDLIRRHSEVKFKQTGSHNIALKIYGNGIMGRIFKTLLKGFNKKHSIDNMTSNTECLPRPTLTSDVFIYRIVIIFAIVWLLMVFEAYGLRMRRIIASFFYRRREKKRIIFLYNEMTKKRNGFLRHARHEVMRKAKEYKLSMKVNILQAWRIRFPRMCFFLRILGLGKRTCLLCGEPQNPTFHFCRTTGCKFIYCRECWWNIQETCYACTGFDEWELDTELSDYDL